MSQTNILLRPQAKSGQGRGKIQKKRKKKVGCSKLLPYDSERDDKVKLRQIFQDIKAQVKDIEANIREVKSKFEYACELLRGSLVAVKLFPILKALLPALQKRHSWNF